MLPLFRGADLETREALTPAWMQQAQVPLLLSIEEQNQVAMRVGGQGEILFFNAKTGVELKRVALPLPAGSEIRSIAQDQPGSPTVALGQAIPSAPTTTRGRSTRPSFRRTWSIAWRSSRCTASMRVSNSISTVASPSIFSSTRRRSDSQGMRMK